MEGSQDSSNQSQQKHNKILRFAASVITTLTLAGSIRFTGLHSYATHANYWRSPRPSHP